MKTLKMLAAALVALLVAACGGGGNSSVTPATPATATVTQAATNVVVTPGETFRVTLLNVDCLLADGSQSCKTILPLGEILITAPVDLQDVQFLQNGVAMQGYVNYESGAYRFVPTGYNAVSQPGSIEMESTLSPYANATSSPVKVAVQVANASVDKKLVFNGAAATVMVTPLAAYAPATVSLGSYDPTLGIEGFQYGCPEKVNGCLLKSFRVVVSNAPANATVNIRLYLFGTFQLYAQGMTDQYGQMDATVSPYAYASQSGNFTVQAEVLNPNPGQPMAPNPVIYFANILSESGGKEIAPQLPSGCTTASPANCNG